ncbi:MAG: DNA polymerase III subunit delta' [Pseudomonadota bacterium]|nr:DNA polymerase III subunit delta' [Pseudomonadota bacterium]
MPVAPSSHNLSLIGHEAAFQQAVDAIASGRLHHAWLLTGIEGIGKATLARQIATHVLIGGDGAVRPSATSGRAERLIAADSHPDLLTLRRATDDKTGETRKVIVVDEALKVGAFLRRTATHGGWRVVVVDEADALNRHAQNAVLKILEEPPARALILMTATRPGALLPTIRSRCRVLQLSPLTDAQIKVILARSAEALATDMVDNLTTLSGGSAGFALKILRSEVLPLYAELVAVIEAPASLDVARLHKLADQISRKADAESYETLTILLLDRLQKVVRAFALDGRDQVHVDRKVQLWVRVRDLFALAEGANLDRKLAFVNAVMDIRNAS